MTTAQKVSGAGLSIGVCILVAAFGYLAYLGAASSWRYYVLVDEIAGNAPQFVGKRLRVSGRVADGSLTIGDLRRHAVFRLCGPNHSIQAVCKCVIPDNLAEGIDVVVEGVLESDGIHGQKIITRCASKYERQTRPPEPSAPTTAVGWQPPRAVDADGQGR